MEVSPRLPSLLQTLEKHPRGGGGTRKRPRGDESLPQDVLEAIMELLERESLCTVRLVSKAFCAAAAAHICSLTLASTSRAVSFHRYPHVKHVTVRHVYTRFLDKESLGEDEEGGSEDEDGLSEEEENLAEEEVNWAQEEEGGSDKEEGWAKEEGSLGEEEGSWSEDEEGWSEEEGSLVEDEGNWALEEEGWAQDEDGLSQEENFAEEEGSWAMGGEIWAEEEEGLAEEVGSLAQEEGSWAEEEKVWAEVEGSLAELDPSLRDLATTLTIGHEGWMPSIAQTRDFLSQAALMPKLRKLEVMGVVEHETALLARCTNLEAIAFGECSTTIARIIVTMTGLTSLHLGIVFKDGDQGRFAWGFSWLGHATNLRNLQALSIHTSYRGVTLIGNLTGLTGLTMLAFADEATFSIAPLTHLTRLRSLSLPGYRGHEMAESDLGIACSLGLGSLVNLELSVRNEASADCGRYLLRQTALTRLILHGHHLCNLRHIAAPELLKCLELHDLDMLDAAGISILCRATNLTAFQIATGITHPKFGLSRALARLTQLRSLTLSAWQPVATKFLDLTLALHPLVALTKLEIARHVVDDGDLRVLLVLTALRVLKLDYCCLTDESLPELGVLTNLSTLIVCDRGVTSLASVSKVLNPLA